MDIRETVLRFLYKNDNGELIDLVKVLEPFDNDATRRQVNELLNNLDKVDKYIFIDKEYRRMIGKNAGKYKPIAQCKIRARLTDNGRAFVERQYLKKDDRPTVKVEVKDGGQVGNINTGNIGNIGQFNQSSNNNLSKPTIPLTIKDKPTTTIMTAITKHTKKIIIGIVVFVIGTLIIWWITGQV